MPPSLQTGIEGATSEQTKSSPHSSFSKGYIIPGRKSSIGHASGTLENMDGELPAPAGPYSRFFTPVFSQQKKSVSSARLYTKYALYEDVTLEDRSWYHQISCRPITKTAEDDMELLSDLVTQGELYLHEFGTGVYSCSRCSTPVFGSQDKWRGPCVWPSFRQPIYPSAISLATVEDYNNYKCCVKEVYCDNCDLFLGHAFEDGKEKGDTHKDAHWRF